LPGQDPEMQLRELGEFAEHPGLSVIGEYVDRMTGSKDSRPSLNRLVADASQRKFDVVLVWKLDRFGRSLRHLVNAIAELEALGVAFVSFRDTKTDALYVRRHTDGSASAPRVRPGLPRNAPYERVVFRCIAARCGFLLLDCGNRADR
jgi:Resolvase, N terminal domain